MTHLSPEQIVDVAEGCADPAAAAHAALCDACRSKAASVADTIRVASEVREPEPSPLFWQHLSARIGEAVRREPARPSFGRTWAWRLVPAGVLAAVVLAVAVAVRPPAPVGTDSRPAPEAEAPRAEAPGPAGAADADDDPSWSLVAALSAEVSVDDVDASGVLPAPGGAEKALGQLDDAERLELAKIIKAEIAARAPNEPPRPGAQAEKDTQS